MKAYSACLWLAERKLGIPIDEQRGEWDLGSNKKKFEWKREELVTALPYEYYDGNNMYFYHDADRGTCIDASNFIDGHLYIEESNNEFYRYSPNRNRRFFHPQRELFRDVVHESDESIPWKELPQLTVNELSEDTCASQDKPALASIAAHLTLLKMLKSGELHAQGFIDFALYPESITAETPHHNAIKNVPLIFWENNPIPNYEVSAVEEGLKRFETMRNHFHSAPFKPDWSLLSQSETWHKKIIVSDNFTPWLMEEVRKSYPVPTKATFKPSGIGYLIQFGTDKEDEIRNSKGLSLLYMILKEYRKGSYNTGSGYSAEAIQNDIIKNEASINNQSKNQIVKNERYQQKLRNSLFDLACKHVETEDEDEKDKQKDFFKKCLYKLNKDNEQVPKSSALSILKMSPDDFYDKLPAIKTLFRMDDSEEIKSIEGPMKNLKNALERLTEKFPHFAYYIGPLTSEKKKGLGYSGDEFYFISDDDITWDFG